MLQTFYQFAIALAPLYPFLTAAVVLLYKYALSRFPANMQVEIDKYVQLAVQAVEQSGSGLSSEDKKAKAVAMVTALLKSKGLPADPILIDAGIEAVVFGFNSTKTAIMKAVPKASPVQDPNAAPVKF